MIKALDCQVNSIRSVVSNPISVAFCYIHSFTYQILAHTLQQQQILPQMKSIWGYISRSNSNPIQTTTQTDRHESSMSDGQTKINIDYYHLRKVIEQIQNLKSINIFQFSNEKVAATFEDVMSTLHGLLNVVLSIKEQFQKNHDKIVEYDRLKTLASQHSEIVKHMEQQANNNLMRVYEQKRQSQKQLQIQIAQLKTKMQQKQQQIGQLTNQITLKQEQNIKLSQQLQTKALSYIDLQQKYQKCNKKIQQMSAIEDNSIKFQAIGLKLGQKIELSNIFIFSKIRKQVYQFLNPKEFQNLTMVSKQFYYICNRSFKKQYMQTVIKNNSRSLQKLGREVKEFEKMFDNFPADNIRTNAIKYLYFKIKPGGYMLPYFQNQQEDQQKQKQKIQEKSKLKQLSSFFKKKNETESVKQKSYTFQSLKNDYEFKEVYKKVETFFDKIFGIEAADDLKNFNETMKKQLNQLKLQLKTSDKSVQLLCMSKYMYLQINQLNNLLQVCFALLINHHNDLKQYKKRNNDLMQNDKVLRNLVENIANDREQVEKRIFFLQNQNIKYRANEQRLQQQNKTMNSKLQQISQQAQKLKEQRRILIQKSENLKSKQKQCEQKWQQILRTINQLPFAE